MADESNVDSILEAYADVLNEQTSTESIAEAAEFKTLPTGEYIVEVPKKEWRVEYKPNPQTGIAKPKRLRAHLQLSVLDKTTGAKKGVAFTDASPIMGRFENGNMDFPAQLWKQIAGIHEADKRGTLNSELYEEIGKFPYLAKVQELFLVPGEDGAKDKWTVAQTVDMSKFYKSKGYRAMNSVVSFKKVA